MQPGRFDRRVTLQSPAGTRDSFGEPQTTWTDEGMVWAHRRDLRAIERFTHQQTDATITTIFTLRYRPDVAPSWRLLDEAGRIYGVDGIRELDRRRTLELLCTTQAGTVA